MELSPLTDEEIQRLLYPRRRAVGPGSFIATIRIPDGSEQDHEITAGTYDGGRLIADRLALCSETRTGSSPAANNSSSRHANASANSRSLSGATGTRHAATFPASNSAATIRQAAACTHDALSASVKSNRRLRTWSSTFPPS